MEAASGSTWPWDPPAGCWRQTSPGAGWVGVRSCISDPAAWTFLRSNTSFVCAQSSLHRLIGVKNLLKVDCSHNTSAYMNSHRPETSGSSITLKQVSNDPSSGIQNNVSETSNEKEKRWSTRNICEPRRFDCFHYRRQQSARWQLNL